MKTAKEIYVKLKKIDSDVRAEQVRAAMNPAVIINELVSISNEADTCLLEDLPRLQLKANINFGLLKKCLPDLRSLEVKENNNNAKRLIIDLPIRDSNGNNVSEVSEVSEVDK